MKQSKRLIALGMAGCLLFLGACGKKGDSSAADEEVKATAVEVQTVGDGAMAASNNLSGQVKAIEAVQVFPQLGGQVTVLNVAEGDMVSAGQVLFEVDTSTVTSTLGALRQSYTSTKAATDQAIASAQLGAKNAQIAVDQAQTSLDNTNALYSVGAASDQDVTNAQRALSQAQSAQAQAQAGVQKAEASQKSSLAQIQASIDQIEAQAKLGTVTSPVSGKITEMNLTKGGMAGQTSPAMVIAENNAMMVSVYASENVRAGLNVGDTASVTIDSVSEFPMTCSIRSIADSADENSKLYEITLYLPDDINPPIGAFANVTLFTDHRDDTIQIPTDAILTSGTDEYVYIVDGSTAKMVNIETGLVGDGVTEITSGLTGGEQLVTKGQSYLADGAAVRIVSGEE